MSAETEEEQNPICNRQIDDYNVASLQSEIVQVGPPTQTQSVEAAIKEAFHV